MTAQAQRDGWSAGDILATADDPGRGDWLTVWGSQYTAPKLHGTREGAQLSGQRGESVAHVTEQWHPGLHGYAYRVTPGSLGPRELTSTDLAREISEDPRFDTRGDAGAAYFDELAVRHGRDLTGIAWIQACLKVDQERAS